MHATRSDAFVAVLIVYFFLCVAASAYLLHATPIAVSSAAEEVGLFLVLLTIFFCYSLCLLVPAVLLVRYLWPVSDHQAKESSPADKFRVRNLA